MALVLDTTTGLRGIVDLQRLARAVVAADEHDEADWLEWKSTLDLATKEGCFTIARAILGLANRIPERAALTCEGLGYVVVGAVPGSLAGVATVDPATFDQTIEPYLGGADGPRWTPTWLPVEGVTVFVVVVEAPRPGDRIFVLRKELTSSRSGAVFVRKHGRTVPADASDHDALQARLVTASRPLGELEVTLVGSVPISWVDTTRTAQVFRAWIEDRKAELVAAARAEEQRRRLPPPPPRAPALDDNPGRLAGNLSTIDAFNRQQAAYGKSIESSGLLGEPDKRTLEEYLAAVEAWAERLAEEAPDVAVGRYFAKDRGMVWLHVRNPTARFLTDVEVAIHFDFPLVSGVEERPDRRELPSEPRSYGHRAMSSSLFGNSASLLSGRISTMIPFGLSPPRRTRVEGGSVHIRFRLGDLRQLGQDTSDEVFLFVGGRPDDGVLHGTWTATIREPEGVLTGTFDLPVAEEPVNLLDLLANELDDEA